MHSAVLELRIHYHSMRRNVTQQCVERHASLDQSRVGMNAWGKRLQARLRHQLDALARTTAHQHQLQLPSMQF